MRELLLIFDAAASREKRFAHEPDDGRIKKKIDAAPDADEMRERRRALRKRDEECAGEKHRDLEQERATIFSAKREPVERDEPENQNEKKRTGDAHEFMTLQKDIASSSREG